jgi:arginyl-tRNA synthetase
VKALLADPAVRFDYYCWDLYARTSSYYKEHPESLEWRSATLHAIEAGEGELAEMAHLVADAIVEGAPGHHAAAGRRVRRAAARERDPAPAILGLGVRAAQERKAIYLETEGKNAGCWVMPGLRKRAR